MVAYEHPPSLPKDMQYGPFMTSDYMSFHLRHTIDILRPGTMDRGTMGHGLGQSCVVHITTPILIHVYLWMNGSQEWRGFKFSKLTITTVMVCTIVVWLNGKPTWVLKCPTWWSRHRTAFGPKNRHFLVVRELKMSEPPAVRLTTTQLAHGKRLLRKTAHRAV